MASAISGRNASSGFTSFHCPPSFAWESAEKAFARSANFSPAASRPRISSPRVVTEGVLSSVGGRRRITLTVVFASLQ